MGPLLGESYPTYPYSGLSQGTSKLIIIIISMK